MLKIEIPKVSKGIIITCIALYLISLSLKLTNPILFTLFLIILGLTPLVFKGAVWQLWTSHLVHFSFLHIFSNLYMFFLLSPDIERAWGSKKYLFFFLIFAPISSFIVLLIYSAIYSDFFVLLGLSGWIYLLMGFFPLAFPEKFRRAWGKKGWAYFIFGVILQIIMIPYELAGMGVAYISHVINFIIGVILGYEFKKTKEVVEVAIEIFE